MTPIMMTISEKYLAGLTYKVIAAQVGCDEGMVYYTVKKLNLPKRGKTGRPATYTGLETEIKCTCCKQVLHISEFPPKHAASKCKSPVSNVCHKCGSAKVRKARYQLSDAQLAWIKTQQCWICGETDQADLCVDHCHETGKLRGVLCKNCNSGLGHVQSTVATCLNMICHLAGSSYVHGPIEAEAVELARTTLPNPCSVAWKYGVKSYHIAQFITHSDGKCPCCGKLLGERASVDHCHATGDVRGVLCRDCNITLGMFQDSQRLLAKAAEYLTSPPGIPDLRDPIELAAEPVELPKVSRQGQRASKLTVAKVTELYNQGLTAAAISRKLGVGGISTFMIKNNIPRRSRSASATLASNYRYGHE